VKTRTYIWAPLLALVAFGTSGCPSKTVKAAPVSSTPPRVQPLPVPQRPVTSAQAEPEPPPEVDSLPAVPMMAPNPTPPRPVPAESEAAKPKPEPPQISPQLSPQQQADAERLTTDEVRTAEKNLQLAGGKQLNASQNDLAEKIRGFLGQAHEAIRTNDWLRAQTLAQKAAILSNELLKSL
jgi:hypothetical protein